ncbi:MAG: polyribonucleotide nucleotidyltransferase [Pseudomonadota bacterium]
MFQTHKQQLEWAGRTLVLETGTMARQADGAVLVTYGATKVLCTAVGQRKANEGVNFFPLTVHYQERAYAAGKVPGGFFKREGRPSEKETLTSRLIDRPIRPLFVEGFRNETQIICTVLQHDLVNNPDIPAMVGASAALALSGLPFLGPIGAARVGYINGNYLLNPTAEVIGDSQLDLVVAGTDQGVMMVESEASELDEATMLGAVEFGMNAFQPVIAAIKALAEEAGQPVWFEPADNPAEHALATKLDQQFAAQIGEAYQIREKQSRQQNLEGLREQAVAALCADEDGFDHTVVGAGFKNLEAKIVRQQILEQGQRIDGRSTTDIRPIETGVGLLERTHGSALFTRGETQALVVTTLGTGQDEQIVDALDGEYRERFLLHYNFPPYSVGEAGRMMSPGRREIGHGKLAWRAIRPLLPAAEEFPYTIRVVAEITESNGSSSMATVCGSSMALMDAGVKLKKPCAGIAMGLIKEGDQFAVLSDILGDEDHLGDMDFKVAGTDSGLTALQMDIKIPSITFDIMRKALEQAKAGRHHILGCMAEGINVVRKEISQNAPRITTMNIAREKIREVIGTGGKVIREICAESGAKVDIDDDGTITIAAIEQKAMQNAIDRINAIVAEPEPGKIYRGKVVRVLEFGAFVNFMGSRDGLVHISELAAARVNQVQDIVKEGDQVFVKCLDIDERGKIRLSMRLVDQKSGELLPDSVSGGERPRRKPSPGGGGGYRDRGDRGEHRGDRGDRGDHRGDRGDRGGNRGDRGDYRGRRSS